MASENCERFGPQARAIFEEIVRTIQPTIPGSPSRGGKEVHDEGWRDLRHAHLRQQYIEHIRRRIGHHLEVDTKPHLERGISMQRAVVSVVSESERATHDLKLIALVHKLDDAIAHDYKTAPVTPQG